MGQLTSPGSKGITVLPVDSESGPGAGAGTTGSRNIFLGLNAGLNAAASDLIVLGNNSGKGGITGTNGMTGTIIGSGNLEAWSSVTASFPGAASSAVIAIGNNIGPTLSNADSSIFIGQNILATLPAGGGPTHSVLIGNNIAATTTTSGASITDTVAIGYGIFQGASGANFLTNCVIIGDSGALNATGLTDSVVIGHAAAQALTGNVTSECVCIGSTAVLTANEPGSVVIGFAAKSQNATGLNTIIGATTSPGANTVRGVVLGYGAGFSLVGGGAADLFMVETNNNVAGQHSMFYGSMATGNLIVGKSIDGTNRDLAFGDATAANIVKLLNGVIATASPVGGGYFYVTGGVLHWVDSAGTNTQLSMTAAGQLAGNSITAYTNNAAANAGTLTNAPAIGNPTKWIPINDAGTIRNIPAW